MTPEEEDEAIRALSNQEDGATEIPGVPGTPVHSDPVGFARIVERTQQVVVLPDGSEIPLGDGVIFPVAPIRPPVPPPTPRPATVPNPPIPLTPPPTGPVAGFWSGSWRTTTLGYAKAIVTMLATFIVVPDMAGISDEYRPFAQILGAILAMLQATKGHVEKDRKAVTKQE